MIDETIETPDGDVQLELDAVEEMMIRLQMPSGIADRCDNGFVEARDIEWMNMIATMATDFENPTNIPNSGIIYIVDCVARLMEDMEIQSYEEFTTPEEEGETSFISEGTLGVNHE